MNSRNSLVLALVFGALATAAFYFRERQSAGGSVTAFRTTEHVAAGKSFAGSIEKISIPKSSFAAMATQVPTGEQESFVSTSPAFRDVPAGTVVTFDMLMKAADPGLQKRVAKGMRAVSIQVSDAQAVAFLVRPGDLVDVLGTKESGGFTTEYVLQAKKVLAVDQNYDIDTVRPQTSFSTITLEVSATEAQKLEQYRVQIKDGFYLALRNQADTDPINVAPLVAPPAGR